MRVHRPKGASGSLPCVYSIHGGGYVLGSYNMDDALFNQLCPTLGLIGVSVEYRLAPETRLSRSARGLLPRPVVDVRATPPNSASTAAASAFAASAPGGGLAAALALLARDRGEIPLAFQLLTARCSTIASARSRASRDGLPVWSRDSNTYGWRSYLGDLYGTDDIPYTAAPARAEDLTGLPPAYVSVGTVDGFLDEDVDYAMRLNHAGRTDRAPPLSGRLPRLSDGRG